MSLPTEMLCTLDLTYKLVKSQSQILKFKTQHKNGEKLLAANCFLLLNLTTHGCLNTLLNNTRFKF